MKRRNYESDFVAKMKLPQGLENIDFELIFSTNGLAKYLASRRGDVLNNCVVDADGRLSVVFKNHGLQPGMLKMKFISFVPNPNIPGDNIQKIVTPRIEDVELVTSAGDECSDITFDIAVDYAIIDAYDMAVKAGYKGSREEYIKMISTKPKSSASNILHRKCISYNSPIGEIYSGDYLIIRKPKVGERYSVVGLADGSTVDYDITAGVMSIKSSISPIIVPIGKNRNHGVKFNTKREIIVGSFPYAARTRLEPIHVTDINLIEGRKGVGTARDNAVYNLSTGVEIELWKRVRRHKRIDNDRHLTQWVKIKKNGLCYSAYCRNGSDVVFLIRARRCNSRRTNFGEWHYFHVKNFQAEPSRWYGRNPDLKDFKKSIKDGLLHVLCSENDSSMLLNGEEIRCKKGESIIKCPEGSWLDITSTKLTGIFRFDGVIVSRINNRNDVVFINNTRVQAKDMVWLYSCKNLESMENTIISCATARSVYGMFSGTRLAAGPQIWRSESIIEATSVYENCENLTSVKWFDTSNVTSFKGHFNNCHSLATVPLYDTSKATNIQNMFTACHALRTLPKYDFSKVTNIVTAFGLMSSLIEFPNDFNFSRVTAATYAFAGDWGYYNEQQDTYQVGGLRRFPAYSLPECTDLQGAWMDQSRLFSIGKLDIPKCTKLDTAFHGCFNLTSVGGFTGLKCNLNMAHCKKLSVASMVNVFNDAANVTALGARTMTLGEVNLIKLTDAQKAIATAKGWTLA